MNKAEIEKLTELIALAHGAALAMDHSAYDTSREISLLIMKSEYTQEAVALIQKNYTEVVETYWKAYGELDDYVYRASQRRANAQVEKYRRKAEEPLTPVKE